MHISNNIEPSIWVIVIVIDIVSILNRIRYKYCHINSKEYGNCNSNYHSNGRDSVRIEYRKHSLISFIGLFFYKIKHQPL